jgi:hypothetical protein
MTPSRLAEALRLAEIDEERLRALYHGTLHIGTISCLRAARAEIARLLREEIEERAAKPQVRDLECGCRVPLNSGGPLRIRYCSYHEGAADASAEAEVGARRVQPEFDADADVKEVLSLIDDPGPTPRYRKAVEALRDAERRLMSEPPYGGDSQDWQEIVGETVEMIRRTIKEIGEPERDFGLSFNGSVDVKTEG